MALFQSASGLEAFIAIILAAGITAGILILDSRRRQKLQDAAQNELDDASAAYRTHLNLLRGSPTDPALRETTLQLGRAYSNLTRNREGVTLFDEVALSNDIGAACAAATAPVVVSSPPQPSAVPVTIQDRLRQLESLRGQALITDDEYAMRRERILDEV